MTKDLVVEQVEHEAKMLERLSHKHIIALKGYNFDTTFERPNKSKPVAYIALQLAKGGELFDFIVETGKFSEKVARYYFHSMCKAFDYMHNKGVSHRDLKPDNILLTGNFNLKIADFGTATEKTKNITLRGTRAYLAPEVLKGKEYSGQAADLFAAGVILFTMVTCVEPFKEATKNDDYYSFFTKNEPEKFWEKHQSSPQFPALSEELKELLTLMLDVKRMNRPSLSEICSHAWYNDELPTKDEVKEEFAKRKEMLKDNLIQDSPVPSEEPSSDTFESHIHRGLNDDDSSDEEVKDLEIDREEQEYDPDMKTYTQFFSTSPVNELFNTLAVYASKAATSYSFANDSYSAVLKILGENGTEDKIKFTVNILKVEEEDMHCIEAVKDEGDRFEFSKIYHQMKEYFGGHANAVGPI